VNSLPTAGELHVTLCNFQGKYKGLNRTHPLRVSENRLLNVASTVGVPIMFAAARSSSQAIALGMYKAQAIRSAVDFNRRDLALPSEYRLMDPTEKANISFWTGMTFASLIADELLEVCWLWHASILRRLGHLMGTSTSRRIADLVGIDRHGQWHAFEAKARQDAPSPRMRDNWKEQARTIKTMNGHSVATHSYAFTQVGDTYSVLVEDPPPDGDRQSVGVEFDTPDMVTSYYGPFVQWLLESPTQASIVERSRFRITAARAGYDPEFGRFIFLGMTADALASAANRILPEASQPADLEDCYVGSDGVVVLTSSAPNL